MKLTFIQLASFVADWDDLELGDDDLRELEQLLMDRPDRGAPVQGTGGLRKVRFAPPSRHTGKRGAARVIYAYFAEFSRLYFFSIYGKNVQEDLTPDEKANYTKLLAALAKRLREEN